MRGICAIAMVWAIFGCGGSAKSPLKPGEPATQQDGPDGWTYKELLSHLQKKGIAELKMMNSGSDVCFLTKEASGAIENQEMLAYYLKNGILDGILIPSKCQSAEDARQRAGRTTSEVHHWGVWYFQGDPKLVASVKKALK